MNITDEMIARACVALYRETSGDFEPTNEEMRAALAAALSAAPKGEPVGGPTGAAWVDANVSGPPALMQAMRNHAEAAALAVQPVEPVAWVLSHSRGIEFSSRYPMQETKEQAEQMARQHMGRTTVTPLYAAPQPARVPLPALPEPSGHTWGYDARMNMTRTPNGHYTANDVYEYGKKCLAAAGVTVADEGGAK